MGIDHARLYVPMPEKPLDRAIIVAPSRGCVADEWQQWVKGGGLDLLCRMSALWPTPVDKSFYPGGDEDLHIGLTHFQIL